MLVCTRECIFDRACDVNVQVYVVVLVYQARMCVRVHLSERQLYATRTSVEADRVCDGTKNEHTRLKIHKSLRACSVGTLTSSKGLLLQGARNVPRRGAWYDRPLFRIL